MKKAYFSKQYGLRQAVLERRKTKTRRIIKGDFENVTAYHANGGWHFIADTKGGDSIELKPAFQIGEVVAVAQSYRECAEIDDFYNCVGAIGSPGWNNALYTRSDLMPNRIRITDIKCERLQDISDEDCLREGIMKTDCVAPYGFPVGNGKWKNYRTPQDAFAALIDKVSGRGTWERNPWVFVYEFELIN